MTAGVSASVTATAYQVMRVCPPGGRPRWSRTNYAGASVTLLAGPAVVTGLAAGILAADRLSLRRRVGVASLVAGVGAVGVYDDLCGSAGVKGLRGHLDALADGEVTSGAAKIAVVSVAALGCAGLVRNRHEGVVLDAGLVAGAANLVNLLDLRPGRALKVVLVGALASVGAAEGGLAAPLLGAAAACLPSDVRAQSMLGDCGANALGALLGTASVAAAPQWLRRGALAVVVAAILTSERVSFTAVIERSPLLRRIDSWGRADRAGMSSRAGRTRLIG